MQRNVPPAWLQSLSDTQDSHTPCEPIAVSEHTRVAGSQLFPPQSAASVAGVHSLHVPPKQRGVPLRWLQWESFMQPVQLSPLQRGMVGLRQ
jgi:hypothetical protein